MIMEMILTPEVLVEATLMIAFLLLLAGAKPRRGGRLVKAVLDRYTVGDFEGALAATERLKTRWPELYLFFRGGVLSQLCRFDEAERCLRDYLVLLRQSDAVGSRTPEHKRRFLAQEMLGEVLLSQGRYDEAMKAFEASLREAAGHGPIHRSIAELWLKRGNAGEALSSAKTAVNLDRAAKGQVQRILNMNLAEDLATLAWAAAAAHKDCSQIQPWIDEAAERSEGQPVSVRSRVHLHLGYAYQELNDLARSLEHLEIASREDTQGLYGRAARARLATVAG
jgi:tetratricopeptide (TPR) repeat protein